MPNMIRRNARQLTRDVRELAAGGFGSLATRLGWQATVARKGFETIGQAEFGFSTLIVDGEDKIAGGQLEKAYEQHLFTNTCVNYIATRQAGVPLRFYRESMVAGERQLDRADDHPVARAFAWFNPSQSDYEAWEWVSSWTLITGQGPILIEPRGPTTPAGIPFELWPLYPNGLTPIRSSTQGISGYRYAVDGAEIYLLPEQIINFREFSTDERWSAMGRLFAGRQEIITDLRARRWNDELLKRGVHVSGTLESDNQISADKADAIRRHFETKYAGAKNANRVVVLHDGLKFKPTTLGHTDIGFLEQLNLTKQDIAMAFGIPEELLGAKSANYAALKEKRKIFWEDTMRSRMRRIEAVLNSTVLPRLAPELRCYFDYSEVEALQPDRSEQIKAGQAAIAGAMMTPNEYRVQVLDLPEVPGGDVLMIGRGLQPLEAALAEAAGATPARDRDAGEASAQASRGLPGLARALRAFEGQVGVTKAPNPTAAALDLLQQRSERELYRAFQVHYLDMERQLSGYITTAGVDFAKSEHLILVEGRQAITARSEETVARAIEKSSGIVSEAIGLTGSLNLENTAAQEVLSGQARRIGNITLKEWETLRTDLQQSIAMGEGEAKAKARVSEFFQHRRKNALTIARTETSQAVNSASYSTLKQAAESGIAVRLQWSTQLDSETRDAHVQANGLQIDPTAERFNVGGDALRYPGDAANGTAENTINCRCKAVPVLLKG